MTGLTHLEDGPVHTELVDNHEDHVAERTHQKSQTRNKLKQHFMVLPKVEVIQQAQEDAKSHVDHPNCHGHFHFQRIKENQTISLVIPAKVDSEGIDATY